jgi:hypothetical protein
MTTTKNSNPHQIEHFTDERIHICLNPIVEWVQLTIQKLIRYGNIICKNTCIVDTNT